jgi:regulator of protease activity HflC (stomatin/prohibitin superfamily)
MDLPTKEGLTIMSDVSILYHVDGQQVPQIVENIGRDYEQVVILPVFRSAAADIAARYYAKDMHTGQRAAIENSIRELMTERLQDRGFTIESVLLKSISLPPGLTRAIEEKLAAEQDSQRMEFVLAKQRQEVERMIIEAEGVRDSQKIINEGLTPMLIQFESIEAFKKLSTSPNSKIIITNGQVPVMITPEQ